MAEKLHKTNLENKELQDKLNTITRQYKIFVQEEDKIFLQKRKIHDEYVSFHDPYMNQHVIVNGGVSLLSK